MRAIPDKVPSGAIPGDSRLLQVGCDQDVPAVASAPAVSGTARSEPVRVTSAGCLILREIEPPVDVRCWDQTGKHILVESISHFDPTETFAPTGKARDAR